MIDLSHARELGRRLGAETLEPLKAAFVDKDEVIDLLGVALAAGEHLFILGPPGTAKSALAIALARRLAGRSFAYLLTRFTEPSELFGPFDIRRLREGELVANTEGMLPEAEIAFLDELFNANSAVLNSLLQALNERIFRRGRESRRMPLLLAVGASNHLPEDEALRALFDRFALRVRCDAVPQERLADLLAAGWRLEQTPTDGEATLALADVRQLQAAITAIDLSPALPAYL
ncbi:MAG TPA: AAA family ATPase, partial [Planctomycetia bacterium]|nr:AAA family ATPase [Planctomycetia bacterium]